MLSLDQLQVLHFLSQLVIVRLHAIYTAETNYAVWRSEPGGHLRLCLGSASGIRAILTWYARVWLRNGRN